MMRLFIAVVAIKRVTISPIKREKTLTGKWDSEEEIDCTSLWLQIKLHVIASHLEV